MKITTILGTFTTLSVALPIFNGNKIAWLALESLCNQSDVDFDWELLVCEEEHENMVGEEYIQKYASRLAEKRCCRILYMSLPEKVTLAKKWQLIGSHIAPTSKAFVLQAADCYSPSKRLSLSYKAIQNGVDWYDIKYGYFYSLISKRVILYRYNGRTNLNMAFKSEYARTIPDTDLTAGIDNFLLTHCESKNQSISIMHDSYLFEDSVDVHGANNISIKREEYFDTKPNIFQVLNTPIDELGLPKDVIEKLKSLEVNG